MKRIFALITVFVMCLFMCSCNVETDDKKESKTDKENVGEEAVTEEDVTVESTKSEEELIEEVIAKAERMVNDDLLDEAIRLLELELKKHPDSDKITDMIEEYTTAKYEAEKKANLEEVEEKVEAGDILGAMAFLETFLGDDGEEDPDYREAYDSYRAEYKSSVLEEAKALADGSDNMGAYGIIEKAIDDIGSDEELENAMLKYKQAYITGVLEEIDKLIADSKINEAKELMTTALEKFPGDANLTAKKAVLDEYKSVGLNTLSPMNGGFSWNDSSNDPVDIFGNTYDTNYAVFHAWGSDHWQKGYYSAEYNITEEYDTLDLTVAPYKDFGENAKSYLRVYVNGVLRYTSPRIYQKTQPYAIPSVDISDADYLKIEVVAGGHGCLILADVTLSSSPEFVSNIDHTKTSLSELSPFNGSFAWSNEYPDNMVEADYTYSRNHVSIHAWGSDHWQDATHKVEYYVNKQYKSLSFDLDAKNDFGQNAKSSVKVYVDDVLVYTSKDITQKTARFNSGEIDISKADYVRIEFDIGGHGCIIFSDAVLTNK